MKKEKKRKTKKITSDDNHGFSPQVTILSNTYALLDGCRGITEYDDGKITFSMGSLSVSILGNNLVIKNFGNDYAEIHGDFSDISFG